MADSDCSIVFAPHPTGKYTTRFIDLTGQSFLRLTVIGYAGKFKDNRDFWWCKCECGKTLQVMSKLLRNSHVRSCGCLAQDARPRKHGASATPEYRTYLSAAERCNNNRVKGYARYGAKGIQFRFSSFEEFLKEIGKKPTPKHTLDRIDNQGHYEPGNVRWATYTQQANNKSTTVMLTLNGETKPITEWFPRNSIGYRKMLYLLRKGRCAEESYQIVMAKLACLNAR